MEPGVIFIVSILGSVLGIWILIFYNKECNTIRNSGAAIEKQADYLEIQMRLLAELLKKHEVTDDAIFKIINMHNSHFQNNS
jgi:hypothetical protein